MSTKVLALDDQWFPKICDGSKGSTIRRHRDDVAIGDHLILRAANGWRRLAVRVTGVNQISLAHLTPEIAQEDGFDSVDALRQALRRYYAALEETDPLIQIRFTKVELIGNLAVRYDRIGEEQFDRARTEMARDMGWGSWTDRLDAVWRQLNLTADDLNRRVGVRPIHSSAEDQSITMEIPAKTLDWNYNGVAGFMSLVAGDVLGSTGVGPNARITSVEFPDSVRAHFAGPRLGVNGVRALCNVHDRPLVAYSVKPRLGLQTDEFAAVCRSVAAGGIDIVEDDERLSNQEICPVIERASAALEATSGSQTIYSANITGRADVALDLAKELVELGVRMLKIDVLPTGYSALQAVSEWLHTERHDVAITVYPAMNKLFEKVIPRSVLLELCRLCGADIVYAGIPPLPDAQRQHDVVPFTNAAELHQLLKRDSDFHLPVLPTISTHVTPLNVGAFTELCGPNVGFFVGAGISAFRGTLEDASTILMRAVQEPALSEDDLDAEIVGSLLQSFGEEFFRLENIDEGALGAFNFARNL